MAVDVLISRGVPESRILFLNLIASPEGIDGFAKRFPKLRVVTAFIDQVSQILSVTDSFLTILTGTRRQKVSVSC
jgi:uracil phosphoribosyltransferase